MEMLCHCGSARLEVDAQLAEVLFEERDWDVLGPEIGGILWSRHLAYRQQSPRLLLLNPQHIDLHVPDFVQPDPLRYADGSASVHPHAYSRVLDAEVVEERGHAEPLRGCPYQCVELRLA